MEIRQRVLQNGVRLVIVPMLGAKTFTQICLMGGGSRYESEKLNGISHMLEHMMFKGTTSRPTAKAIATEIETLGGRNNAFTSDESVGYWVNAPADSFERVTDILSDQLLNSLLESEELDREKNAVLEEMNMRASDPLTSAFDSLSALIYGDQAAGRDPIGTKEKVLSLTREQLKRYMDRYTVGDNVVVVVAGCIPDEERALSVLSRRYSPVSGGKKPRKYKLHEVGQSEPEVAIKKRDLPQTSFALAIRSLSRADERVPALEVLSSILGGGMSSRLFLEVRERRGLAYSIGATNYLSGDTGNTIVYGGVSPENMNKALVVVKNELVKLTEEAPEEAELRKVKNMLKASLVRRAESSSRMAMSVSDELLVLGSVTSPEEELEQIHAVTAEDVQLLAQELFTNKSLNLSVVGPHESVSQEEFFEAISF